MKTLKEIKQVLAEHKEELRERFGVKGIGIFGSYAREEQRKGSDLDIIVEFEEEPKEGLEFAGLMIDLEEYIKKILGIKVHLASKTQTSNSDKWQYIKDDLVYV